MSIYTPQRTFEIYKDVWGFQLQQNKSSNILVYRVEQIRLFVLTV